MQSFLPRDVLELLNETELRGKDVIKGAGPSYRGDFIIFPQKYFEEISSRFPFGFVHAAIFPESLLEDFPISLDEEGEQGSLKQQLIYLIASGIKLTDSLYHLNQERPQISEKDVESLKNFLEKHFKENEEYLLKKEMPPFNQNSPVHAVELEYLNDSRSKEYDSLRFQEMEKTEMFYLGGLDKSPLFTIYLPVSRVDSRALKKSFVLAREKLSREIKGEPLSDLYEKAKLPTVQFDGIILEDVGFFAYLRSTPDIVSLIFYESVNNLTKPVTQTNSYSFLSSVQDFYDFVIDYDKRIDYELFV